MNQDIGSCDNNQIMLEHVSCDFCGSGDVLECLRARDWWHNVPGLWRLVRCKECGLVYLNPRPIETKLMDAYPANYDCHQVPGGQVPTTANHSPLITHNAETILVDSTLRSFAHFKNRVRDSLVEDYYSSSSKQSRLRVHLISPLIRSLGLVLFPSRRNAYGNALDIGCGGGRFLATLNEFGWHAQGVEPDREAAHRAEAVTGCTVAIGTVPGVELEASSFDFISMLHVLEHTPRPGETLREVFSLLKPQGRLLVVVPNFQSLERKLTGASWRAVDPPRHLFHFEPATLRNYLESTGFRVNQLESFDEAWSLELSMRQAISSTCEGRFLDSLLKPVSHVLGAFFSLFDRGSILVAYCERS